MKTMQEPAYMSIEAMKREEEKFRERADKVRAKIASLKDSDLVYFADSIYFSTFKSITEHIKDVANEYDPTLPF